MAGSKARRIYERLPLPAQSAAVALAGWQAYRLRFGRKFQRALAELQERDEVREGQVREHQAARLRGVIQWAARTVPYYRRLFKREGIDPARIRSPEDLRLLPLLDKETVRRHEHDLLSEAVPKRRRIRGRTSGTTGTALRLWQTREALAWEYAAAWRQRGWHGLQPGDRFAAFGGQIVVPFAQSRPPFWRADPARGRMLFSLYHLTPHFLPAFIEELTKSRYSFWQGYPSSIALVAEQLLEQNIDLGAARPRAIFTSSESLLPLQRARIERGVGAPVADRYANSELCVSVSECPEGSYHVDTEFCVAEILPEEREQATSGEVRGEVIATGLTNLAMPLIRYRTGDHAALQRRALCSCGRGRPLLESIDGRIEDYVVTPDGRRIGRLDHIFKEALEIKEAQIYQPTADRIIVRIVPRAGFGPRDRQELDGEFRERLGPEMKIDYDWRQSLPRSSSGKLRAVVSDVGQAASQGRRTPVAEAGNG